MELNQFRKAGKAAVEWVANYWRSVDSFPVLPAVEPGQIFNALPGHAPEEAESIHDVIRDLVEVILPGVTHWQSPHFYAYFPNNVSGPSVIGELIAAGLGVQGMLWQTSPACTELEMKVLDWLAELLGLPDKFCFSGDGGGVMQDTASSSVLCAVVAARERATSGKSNRGGVGGKLTAYTSGQAHSSVEKAIRIAGIGSDNLRLIDVDESFAMQPALLEKAIKADKRRGRRPFFVNATVGTTSSGAVDPVKEIGEICRRHNAWLHVDAAMFGAAAICPRFRHIHDGVELADSYCFNPYKWLLTNFDASCLWVADRKAITGALGITPEYLRNKPSDTGEVIDYRDWHVPLAHRFRALKIWFVLRCYGAEGLRRHVRRHVALAQLLASLIRDDKDLELAAEPRFSLVCFRHRAGDDATRRLMDALNSSGRIFLSHTVLGGRLALRMAVGATQVDRRHIEQAWELIRLTTDMLQH